MSGVEDDLFKDQFMNVAFQQSEEALNAGEVPIGCCFVSEGVVIATGRNEVNLTRNATRHAEMVAIDAVIAANKKHLFESMRFGCRLFLLKSRSKYQIFILSIA